jgi:HEPN domain-containing protein
VSVSRRLRREREVSFYGDDEPGAAPDRLYTRADADQAVGDAAMVVDLCERHGPDPPG